jgi:hypothetical protein
MCPLYDWEARRNERHNPAPPHEISGDPEPTGFLLTVEEIVYRKCFSALVSPGMGRPGNAHAYCFGRWVSGRCLTSGCEGWINRWNNSGRPACANALGRALDRDTRRNDIDRPTAPTNLRLAPARAGTAMRPVPIVLISCAPVRLKYANFAGRKRQNTYDSGSSPCA